MNGSAKNYWHLNGVVLINDAENAFASVPWEQYNAHYNQRESHWDRLEKQNLFFTKEQIIEDNGDPFFFFRSQIKPNVNDHIWKEPEISES